MIPVNRGITLFPVCSGKMKVMPFVNVAALFLLLFAVRSFSKEKLYVFYPTTERPRAIQDKMEKIINGTSVTVFGRHCDFIARIATDPPDAILTKPLLLMHMENFAVRLTGVRKGRSGESYVLLSVKNSVEITSVNSNTVIGVVDVFGRTGLKTFMGQFFSEEPRIKRVTKVEDLLPLLSFNMAAAILIEDFFIDYFTSTSQLPFQIVRFDESKYGIIALGVNRNGSNAETILNTLKNNDGNIGALFGLDSWK